MVNTTTVERFGPFELDAARRVLSRDGAPLAAPQLLINLLIVLVSQAGKTVPKNVLVEQAWQDEAVTDNNIYQAIRRLRLLLSGDPRDESYVKSHARVGYRFVAPVESRARASASVDLEALLAPLQAFATGRAALESMDLDNVEAARADFLRALAIDPSLFGACLGLATARLLVFESTRSDREPDATALADAEQHARRACELNPISADAWGTLALVWSRMGRLQDALVAAKKAVNLEPDEWLHYLRLAAVSWGEERIRAARGARRMRRHVPIVSWFIATVLVARGELDAALADLRAGCALQQDVNAPRELRAPGLHFLAGLILLAQEQIDQALEEFERELAMLSPRHVYSRECSANCWYAIGAAHLRARRVAEAKTAFGVAMRFVPTNPVVTALQECFMPGATPVAPVATVVVDTVNAAVGAAIPLVFEQKWEEASRLCATAVAAEGGSAGWIIPVEPLLHTSGHAEAWWKVLVLLATRAR